MTYKNARFKKNNWHRKSDKVSVYKLDAYIGKYERKFGKISSLNVLPKERIKLIELTQELIDSIEKEERNKQQAFETLKVSNDLMKETISKLQDSMKVYKESVRSEIAKLDSLNTDRLLKINYMCI
ncbi:uncharacterized protein LOC143365155 [Halictus rubicundus]|uniref:uncharacterized protein LOC143352380 n=1 Tax=Halictus rubicundus TaxID=77578 RepID=UPI004035B584